MSVFLAVVPLCSGLTAQTPHTATLTWTWSQGDGPAATGFNVKRGTTTGGPYAVVANLTGTTIWTYTEWTYTDASGPSNILSPGTTYYYGLVREICG
jgi:hypothetical protein